MMSFLENNPGMMGAFQQFLIQKGMDMRCEQYPWNST
jgi:hypothetical protein